MWLKFKVVSKRKDKSFASCNLKIERSLQMEGHYMLGPVYGGTPELRPPVVIVKVVLFLKQYVTPMCNHGNCLLSDYCLVLILE